MTKKCLSRNTARIGLHLLAGLAILIIGPDGGFSPAGATPKKEPVFIQIPGIAMPIPLAMILATDSATNVPSAVTTRPATETPPSAGPAVAAPPVAAAPPVSGPPVSGEPRE